MAPLTEPPAHHSDRAFWVGVAIGVPAMAFGIRGALMHTEQTHAPELFKWIVGSAVVHDALLIPIVTVVVVVGRRIVPSWAWPATRWALFVSAILIAVSRPFVGRYGYNPGNPTALSRDYGKGVLIVLALTWATAALMAARVRLALTSKLRGPR